MATPTCPSCGNMRTTLDARDVDDAGRGRWRCSCGRSFRAHGRM